MNFRELREEINEMLPDDTLIWEIPGLEDMSSRDQVNILSRVRNYSLLARIETRRFTYGNKLYIVRVDNPKLGLHLPGTNSRPRGQIN